MFLKIFHTFLISVLCTIVLNINTVQIANAGSESGGGGSKARESFYKPMNKSLQRLSSQPEYIFTPKSEGLQPVHVKVAELISALRSVTLIPVHKQLYDKDGVKADLLNNHKSKIWFNVEKWNKMMEPEQIQFGIHEILGILNIADPFYFVSRKLAEYAEAKDTSKTVGAISVCGVNVDSLGYATEGANVKTVMEDFSTEGGQVRTCLLKDELSTDEKFQTVVIAVFLDKTYALIFR